MDTAQTSSALYLPPAAVGKARIFAPTDRSATANSYCACRFQPELGVHAKPMAKPQGAVSGHRTLAGQDLADAIGWHVNRLAKLAGDTPLSSSSSFRIPPG